MKSDYYLSVEDILMRKHFEHAKVIAGHKGIRRQVKWVHVVEVTTIRNLLNGNELILTTGLALKEEETFLSLIQQLIESGASAIGIELDTNITEIPVSVLRCAEENDFPVVVFEKEVPFVGITQDIHSILINQQYSMIKKLDCYAQELNKVLLSVNDYKEILQVMHKELSVPVLLQLDGHNVGIHPKMRRSEEHKLLLHYRNYQTKDNDHFALAKVILFDREYADLLIYRNDFPFSEYELLILDRTATALAQYLMRELYFNEKKRTEESRWIKSWIKDEQSSDWLTNYLAQQKVKITGGVVCICQVKRIRENENLDLTYFNLVTRNIFEQHGFQVLAEKDGDSLIFILLDTRECKTWRKRITSAYERILESDFCLQSTGMVFATGKYQEKADAVHKSFVTAKDSLLYPAQLGEENGFYFSDDLHLYRLISIVNQNVNLWQMTEEFLGPVLKYDEAHDGSLLQTLKVFLRCQGSKQQTAKQLFIVRQTLYHRLKKIEELLGADYMEAEKRVAIEFLLSAHDYLQPSEARDRATMN
jgi:PucR family transcriptional regulator, purine catabolism regulatory protein